MKHEGLDRIYGSDYIGTPVEPGETWPRFDVMLRNGQELAGVPGHYRRAIRLFERDPAANAERIDELISTLCVPYDRTNRIARLRALG